MSGAVTGALPTGKLARTPVPGRVRQLTWLLGTAFVVSLVHYTDGVVNFSAYPKSGTIPNPSAAVIGLAWVAFTAMGVVGYLRYRRQVDTPALLLLAGYSGSGLIGFLHYSVAGAVDMAWWRQAHIIADILCGLAIFAFVLRDALGR